MRTRTLLLLAAAATVVTIAGTGVATRGASGGAPSRPAGPTSDQPVTEATRASTLLRGWDRRRAGAWSRGDARALADLYTSGSRTGRRDVHELRRWRSRGLRVVGMREQVVERRVVIATGRRLVLVVTDRAVDAIAVGRHRRTALPTSVWTRHRIRLRRVHGQWLVAEVRTQPAR